MLLKFPDTAMGDVLAWFPYAEEFRKKHGCNLYCALNPKFSAILKAGYPEIHFVDTETVPKDLYASYYVGLFAPWDLQPVDWLTSFLAVYREGAETVLFYFALFGDAGSSVDMASIVAGFVAGTRSCWSPT